MNEEQPKKKKKGERSDGRIQVRVNIGRDDKGRIKYKYFYGRTIKEANAKAEAYKLDLLNYGKPLDTTSTTLSEWTYKYLFNSMFGTVAASTFERNVSIYNNHIKPSNIANMPIKDILPCNIEELLNTKTSLSKSSLKKIHDLLRYSFNYAIANNIIRINPVESVKLPSSEVKKKEIEILTIDEQRTYMNAIKGHRYELILTAILATGMRVGEAIALKWENINLNTGMIKICETARRTKVYDKEGNGKRELVTKSPKTEKGYREIPIQKTLLTTLKLHNLASSSDYVFSTRNNTPIAYNHLVESHNTLCDKAGIRRVGIHALRHTFATRSIEAGINVKTVSELLGHSKVQITLDTYVHSTDDVKRDAMNIIDNLYESILK